MTILKLLGVAALTLSAAPALAASPAEIDEMVATTRLLKRHYQRQTRTIDTLQGRIKTLQGRVQELEQQALAARRAPATAADGPRLAGVPARAPTAAAAALPAGATAPSATPASATPASATAAAAAVGAGVKPGTAQATALTSTQGLPLFERRFSFEQGVTYTHYDKRSLVLRGFLALDSILLGQIDLQQIKTDQLQLDLTGRWALSERLSVDLNLPLVYRRSLYFSPGAGGAAADISDQANASWAQGDASAGLYYQLPKAAPTALDWIASVRVKAPSGRHPFGIKLREAVGNDNLVVPSRQPTGNGVWAATLGMSVLNTYDPVVLFGNIGYNYNRARGFDDLSGTQNTVTPGEVKLGNAWSLGAGFALALNDKTSVSLSYSQLVQKAARLRGQGGPWSRQVGSDANSAMLNSGLTHQLSPRLSMVGTLSIGLTPDAPNFSVGVRFPYAY